MQAHSESSLDLQPFPCEPSPKQGALTSAQLEASLAQCMRRIAARDQLALAELYDATVRRVFAVALRFVNDHQTAEEIVSDVYFQAWRDAASYDAARGLVQTWLLMMCRSRSLDALRKHDCAIAHPDPWRLAEEPADEKSDPQDIVTILEQEAAIRRKVAALDAPTRELIELAFFGDLTHAEIAAKTGLPLGTVKTRIRKALRSLRDEWDEQ